MNNYKSFRTGIIVKSIIIPLLAVIITAAGLAVCESAVQSRLPDAAAYSQEAQN